MDSQGVQPGCGLTLAGAAEIVQPAIAEEPAAVDRLALLAAPLPGDDVAAMFKMSDPPARWMAPSIPPPPSSEVLAALSRRLVAPSPTLGSAPDPDLTLPRLSGRHPISHRHSVSPRSQIHLTTVRESVRAAGT